MNRNMQELCYSAATTTMTNQCPFNRGDELFEAAMAAAGKNEREKLPGCKERSLPNPALESDEKHKRRACAKNRFGPLMEEPPLIRTLVSSLSPSERLGWDQIKKRYSRGIGFRTLNDHDLFHIAAHAKFYVRPCLDLLSRMEQHGLLSHQYNYGDAKTQDVLHALLRRKIMFPLFPGFQTSKGKNAHVIYFHPSRFDFLHESMATFKILLMYVIHAVTKQHFSRHYRLYFLVNLSGWTTKDFAMDAWLQIIDILQGQTAPVHTSRVLFVNAPDDFDRVYKMLCPMCQHPFDEKLVIVSQDDLVPKYFAKGQEALLPKELRKGKVDADELIREFIVHCRLVDQAQARESRPKCAKMSNERSSDSPKAVNSKRLDESLMKKEEISNNNKALESSSPKSPRRPDLRRGTSYAVRPRSHGRPALVKRMSVPHSLTSNSDGANHLGEDLPVPKSPCLVRRRRSAVTTAVGTPARRVGRRSSLATTKARMSSEPRLLGDSCDKRVNRQKSLAAISRASSDPSLLGPPSVVAADSKKIVPKSLDDLILRKEEEPNKKDPAQDPAQDHQQGTTGMKRRDLLQRMASIPDLLNTKTRSSRYLLHDTDDEEQEDSYDNSDLELSNRVEEANFRTTLSPIGAAVFTPSLSPVSPILRSPTKLMSSSTKSSKNTTVSSPQTPSCPTNTIDAAAIQARCRQAVSSSPTRPTCNPMSRRARLKRMMSSPALALK